MLHGQGAFVAWHDIEFGREAAYDRWHSHEHMLERVGIPGFLGGRRYVAVGSAPRYLVLYEVADVSVLTSPAYLDRLNDPTAWTREIMPSLRGMNRTLCRVEASFGVGIGQTLVSIRLAPREEAADALRDRLCRELARLPEAAGVVGSHLLIADPAASRAPTRERRLRGGADAVADWVALVEGYDHEAVAELVGGSLAPAALERLGAERGAIVDSYRLVHVVTKDDATAAFRTRPPAPAPG